MRKLLTVLAPTVPVLLAITVVAGCGDDSGPRRSASSDATSTTAPDGTTQASASGARATTTAPPSTTASTSPEPTAADTTSPPDEQYSGCSEGGAEEAVALQRAYEDGHQPWRASPESVAEAGAACALGTPGTVEPVGDNRYRATDAGGGAQVVVEVAQPLGPGTVWLVASVTST
jgi:hypothetical protein